MKKKLTIGTRESLLALAQSRILADHLKSRYPDMEISLLPMKTTGDKILDRRLDEIGGKGLFVRELEQAMRDGRCDCAVHSLKDLPMELPVDLPLVCVSKREDPRDVLVLPESSDSLDFSKPIGTSSLRRILQLRSIFPEARFESVRGNLQTRLKKLDEGQYSALVLAAAGLKRQGLAGRIYRYFDADEVIPATGQGILAVQGTADLDPEYFEDFFDEDAFWCMTAERSFVKALNGGCSSPIAAYARVNGGTLVLNGLYVPDGTLECRIEAVEGDAFDAERLGRRLAQILKYSPVYCTSPEGTVKPEGENGSCTKAHEEDGRSGS